jgi:hypothetical protein
LNSLLAVIEDAFVSDTRAEQSLQPPKIIDGCVPEPLVFSPHSRLGLLPQVKRSRLDVGVFERREEFKGFLAEWCNPHFLETLIGLDGQPIATPLHVAAETIIKYAHGKKCLTGLVSHAKLSRCRHGTRSGRLGMVECS